MQDGIKYGLRQPTQEALSTANLNLISRWMSTCREDHSLCREHHDMPPLPTRVVDVGQVDGSTDPCLIISNGMKDAYITLSHCWGAPRDGQAQLKLTSLNITSMMRKIPLDSMPATFRDAVISTRTLGYRYLWIDSLCIIQDSSPDWESESANMDRIYRDAILTLAA